MITVSFIPAVFLLFFIPSTVTAQPDNLTISISFPDQNTDTVREDTQIQAIITNTSDEPLRLWETWNSWGWYNLSFEILDDSCNILHTLEKMPRAWTRNFASFFILAAEDQYAIEVCLNETDWLLPVPGEEYPGGSEAYMRALFTIPEDKETDEYGIWTGRIESEPVRFSHI